MAETNAVAIKFPTFWAQQPEVWFLQAEAQFHIRKITGDTTKYYHVVAALDQETSGRVLGTLSSSPTDNKYADVKQRLLTTFGLSKREQASKLLHLHPLGDQKPSELMDEMLSLLADHGFCFLAEQLFLEQLPEDIRLQLSNDDFTNPRALATKADVLWIAKQQAASTINKVISQANGKITTTHDSWCFYHKCFGDDAKNCKAPCKHPAAPKIAAVTTCRDKQARLLYVKDDISGRRFLVDTEALVSVFPASGLDTRSHHARPLLEAANGSTIHTYGEKQMTLSINGRKYVWKFSVADVTQPLLGADFLCSNTLMVDVKAQRLVDPATYTSLPLFVTNASAHGIHNVAQDNDFSAFLKEFPDILTPTFSNPTAKHGVVHYISTEGPPIHSRARRLPPEKLVIARDEFRTMEEMGIIRRSTSQWASPLHMVPKQSGSWRPCGATDVSTMLQFQIDTQYLIYKISLLICLVLKYYQKWT